MNDFVELAIDQISEQALQGVIENYITREGTDYGRGEFSLAQKVEQVMRQLRAGRAVIVYDPMTETTTILPKEG